MAAPAVGIVSWHRTEPGKQIANYLDRVRDAGLEPVSLSEPGQTLQGLAGLVLTGGVDIDPALYKEEPHPRTKDVDADRDAFELRLLKEAYERDLPVLAICRGQQILNVFLGGSLLQHIEDWSHAALRDEERTSANHEVVTTGALCEILGGETLAVNSRHHQAVTADRLATGLENLAVTDDGLIEGVRDPNRRWVIGVQWHPERLEPDVDGFNEHSRRLFAAFASAAGLEI